MILLSQFPDFHALTASPKGERSWLRIFECAAFPGHARMW